MKVSIKRSAAQEHRSGRLMNDAASTPGLVALAVGSRRRQLDAEQRQAMFLNFHQRSICRLKPLGPAPAEFGGLHLQVRCLTLSVQLRHLPRTDRM